MAEHQEPRFPTSRHCRLERPGTATVDLFTGLGHGAGTIRTCVEKPDTASLQFNNTYVVDCFTLARIKSRSIELVQFFDSHQRGRLGLHRAPF